MTGNPQHRRPPRWVAIVAGVIIGGVVITLLASHTPSPVGHWNSGSGRDAFVETYRAAFDDLPTPAETRDIRTDHGIVRVYRFEGDAERVEPLVLLPGRASASPVWADNLPTLLELGDVYTIDLLGEPGMSLQERPIENDDDQAAWLHQVLEALPEPTFHVIGLSIGGWTATNLAIRQPDHILTLTVIEPVQVFADLPVEVVVRSIPASLPWLPRSWRDDFNSWTAGGAPVDDVPVAEMIESGMQNYTLALPAPTRIAEESLADLEMPVLAIIAGESVMHDTDAAIDVAERTLGRASVRVFPGASHAISGEHPGEIALEIDRFLDGEN